MSKVFEILLRIIESPRCLWLFVSGWVPTAIYYYNYQDSEFAFYVLIFLSTYIALSILSLLLHKLFNAIDSCKEKRYHQQQDDALNRQIKGYAEDCYHLLSDYDKHILMYAVLYGQRGKEWGNKILLTNCPRAHMVRSMGEKLNKYGHPELLKMDDLHSMNFDIILNRFLLGAIESDIMERNLTKESVEQFFVDENERVQKELTRALENRKPAEGKNRKPKNVSYVR